MRSAGESSPIAKLVEANVAVECDCHEEDKGCVEEDETRLSDVSVVCERGP